MDDAVSPVSWPVLQVREDKIEVADDFRLEAVAMVSSVPAHFTDNPTAVVHVF